MRAEAEIRVRIVFETEWAEYYHKEARKPLVKHHYQEREQQRLAKVEALQWVLNDKPAEQREREHRPYWEKYAAMAESADEPTD